MLHDTNEADGDRVGIYLRLFPGQFPRLSKAYEWGAAATRRSYVHRINIGHMTALVASIRVLSGLAPKLPE
jgi:hypothetical protein